LRPPVLLCFSTSGAYGAPLCSSGVTTRTALRRPAEVGLKFINGMGASSGLGVHDVDGLAVGELHVGLAPVATATRAVAEGLVLALHVDHVDSLDLDVEQLLDRVLDVGLGGVGRHFERVLVGHFLQARGLLGHARRADQRIELGVVDHASHSSSFFTASAVTSTLSAPTSETGSRPCTSRISTYGRLRADRYRCSEASSVTISGRRPRSKPFSFSTRPFVFVSSTSKVSTTCRRPWRLSSDRIAAMAARYI